MGGSPLVSLGAAARSLVRQRAYLAWAALGVSLAGLLVAGLLVGDTPLGARWGFAASLGASAVFSIAMFLAPTTRIFRIFLFPRVLALVVLLLLPSDVRGLDLILTLPLLLEIGIAEAFPISLGLCAAAVLLPLLGALLVLSGGTAHTAVSTDARIHADWIVVSACFSMAACLMVHYRERMLELERERRRLDGAVAELAHANLGYQEYAAAVEQRTMVEERKRITREIHDIIGYTLTNNIMMMEAAVEMVRRDPQGVSRLITEARRNAEDGLDGIRNALYLLRAQEDPRLAGVDLIARLVSGFNAATGVAVRLEYGNTRDSIDHETEGVLFHVIQEALTNSFRHGKATRVEILFWKRDDGTLVVNIDDNGGGAVDIHEGIGVTGMRERLSAVRGTLRLHMGARGFAVTVEVPPGPAAPPPPQPAAVEPARGEP